MIRINLLPLEKRRPERTPLPRFIAIVAGTLFTAITISLAAYTYLGTLKNAQADYTSKETELNNLKAIVAEGGKDKTENERLKKVIAVMSQVENTRKVFWYKQLDKLCTLLDKNNAWIISLNGVMSGDKPLSTRLPDGKDYDFLYKMKFTIFTPGSSYEPVTRLRKQIYDSFAPIDKPPDAKPPIFYMPQTYAVNQVPFPKYMEKYAMSFEMELGHLTEKKPGN